MKFPICPPLSVRLAPALIALLAPVLDAQQSCDQLAGLKLPHTTIVSSTLVPEGPFSASGAPGALPPVTVPPARPAQNSGRDSI